MKCMKGVLEERKGYKVLHSLGEGIEDIRKLIKALC